MDLLDMTIKELHNGFLKKKFSSVEVTKTYLERIKKQDNKIGAFLSITEELALEQAKKADALIAGRAEFPILTGVPCAIKDNILVQGQKCSAGSKMLEHYTAPYDAAVTAKLKGEGAVVLGKTNLDEFAMGGSNENSAFWPVKNPHDTERVAGGSSGGSAAAVASWQACYALGSDTGGSIRLPASFCGVVGLKPTYGAVSRYGLVAFASSLDQIGPIAGNVEDCKTVFDKIIGKDPLDSTSVEFKVSNSKFQIPNLRIGVPREYFGEGISPDVEKATDNAIKKAEEHGAKIVEISLPHAEYAVACYYIIATSEASANLARYDGIKYGFSEPSETLWNTYVKSRGHGFGAEVKRRIILGTYSLSSGYYDAYYKKAQEVRQLIRRDFENAFNKADVIFSPVSPFPAFKLGEKIADPLSMYLVDTYTVSANLAGIPALSMPAGKSGGLPVGLQIMGNYFEENKILAIAEQMEKMLK